jgi:hypothetical protein
MKAYLRNGSIAPRILDLGTRWRWVVSFTPRPLYPQGKRRNSVTHWLGGCVGPRSILDTVEKKIILTTRRETNPRTPIVQPVAQHYTDWAITALPVRRSSFIQLVSLYCTQVGLHTSIRASYGRKIARNTTEDYEGVSKCFRTESITK